jgi:hypothetical protein
MIHTFLVLPYWQQMLCALAIFVVIGFNLPPRRFIPSKPPGLKRPTGVKPAPRSRYPGMPLTESIVNRVSMPEGAAPPALDPLHPAPRPAQPILFADGYRVTPEEIHACGFAYLLDDTGRIVSMLKMDDKKPPATRTVEEWIGEHHGARIS